ncbi:MAG TPA: translation initiation factor IF-6 [Candidatus Nitrosotalea sp.]|nr:translation initiation factor IF-6 [Nitrososphaerota archaeon]HKU32973.1 translation initiation factor IF-6 [Candidatus Nitrosotalea sp.]
MGIFKYDVYRSPNVGIYAKCNDSFVFVPNGFATTKVKNLCEFLKTEHVFTSVANTRLLGALMVVNNNGLLLPRNSLEEEVVHLKKSTGLNVDILDTKHTALGNLICVNDKGGIMSPLIPTEYVKKVEDVLGIEVIRRRIAGYHQAGAMAVATSRGGIIHPATEEEDIKAVSQVLGVELEPATINGGTPYVSSGILANNSSLVVGTLTNGPELVMLTKAFRIED